MEPLIDALGHELPSVRINAAKALGKIKDNTAVEALIIALQEDTIWEIKKWSAWSFGELNDCRASESLVHALYDEDYYVRLHAELALEKMNCSNSIPLLVSALGEKSHPVRTRTAWALEEITDENFGQNVENWKSWLSESERASLNTN